MKYFTFILLLSLCIGCVKDVTFPEPEKPAAAPDESKVDHRADEEALRDSAWFLGAEAIPYCLATGDAKWEPVVEEAAGIWRDYLKRKHVDEHLVFNLQKVACEKALLKIHIGASDDKTVEEWRTHTYPDRNSFSVGHDYKVETGRGDGFIWIASPDRLAASLRSEENEHAWVLGHLLHEMGHTLGCGHVDHTIMTNEITEYLLARMARMADLKERLPLGPDVTHELYICRDCAFETTMGWTMHNPGMFQWLFGDNINVGDYSLSVGRAKDGEEIKMRITAGEWTKAVPIKTLSLVREKKGDGPIFKIVTRGADGQLHNTFKFHETLVYEGNFANIEGHTEAVRIIRNTDLGPLVLETPSNKTTWLIVREVR